MAHLIEPKDESSELLARYRRLREFSRKWNDELVKQIPRREVREIDSLLGLSKCETLTSEQDADMAMLLDLTLYQTRRGGKNIVQRHAKLRCPKLPADDERRIVLQAMADSRYSFFSVVELRPGLGAIMRDLVSDAQFLLVDVNLSHSMPLDLVLASRVIEFGDFCMTTGAAVTATEVMLGLVDAMRREARERGAKVLQLTGDAQTAVNLAAVMQYCEGNIHTEIRYAPC